MSSAGTGLTKNQHRRLQAGIKNQAQADDGEMRTILSSLGYGVNQHIHSKEDTMDVSDFASLVPDTKRKFDFELDDFQKRTVNWIKQGGHGMVIAQTSAVKPCLRSTQLRLPLSTG